MIKQKRWIEKRTTIINCPLNEARMFCDSIMTNKNKLVLDKTIKYDPAKSVLKVQVGDENKLTEKDFELISKSFFAEIESKFAE